MSQLCHALQFMHKRFVGCFLRPCDILVDHNLKLKVRNLSYAYSVGPEQGWKDVKSSPNDPKQQVKL